MKVGDSCLRGLFRIHRVELYFCSSTGVFGWLQGSKDGAVELVSLFSIMHFVSQWIASADARKVLS